MDVTIIKGPRALALHLRKLLLECGVFGPWIVRRADAVRMCADQWCIDLSLKNTETGASTFAIIGIGGVDKERIHIAADEPQLSMVREMVCDCLAASGVEPRALCGKRRY
jgi:hypothetical protein